MKNKIAIGIVGLGLIVSGVILASGNSPINSPGLPPVEKVPPVSIIDSGTELKSTFLASTSPRGEIKTTFSKIEPKITVSKWSGQASLSISSSDVLNSAPQTANNIVVWDDGVNQLRSYTLASSTDGMEDGGIEMELIIHSKPLKKTFEFPMANYQDFDFIYQPPLNDESFWNFIGNKGIVSCTETQCFDKDGVQKIYMPDNIVGSYEIRYKNFFAKANVAGQIKHETGIFGYYHRPQFTDGAGKKMWGTVTYSDGKFIVTIPDFVYNDPTIDWSTFIIDPTFGYTPLGGTTDGTNKFANANSYTADTTCTPTQANFGGYMSSGTGTTTMAIYDFGDGNISGNNRLNLSSEITLIANGTTGSFRSAAIGGPDIVNGTTYFLEGWSNTTGVNMKFSANAVTAQFTNTGTTGFPPLVHPTRGGPSANQQYSLYIDCTVAATGGQHKFIINNVNTVFQANHKGTAQ